MNPVRKLLASIFVVLFSSAQADIDSECTLQTDSMEHVVEWNWFDSIQNKWGTAWTTFVFPAGEIELPPYGFFPEDTPRRINFNTPAAYDEAGPWGVAGQSCLYDEIGDIGCSEHDTCNAPTIVVQVTGGECDVPPGVPESESECSDSPILIDLDRNQFHLSAGPVNFDIDADGLPEDISWVTAGSYDELLYLDLNGDGQVKDGSELFGTATRLMDGNLAENGFEALAEFDQTENGGDEDGVISPRDSIFSSLRIWVDVNADGYFEAMESLTLVEAQVLSIQLKYSESRRLDEHGNMFKYISSAVISVNGQPKNTWVTDVFFKVYGGP
jgi:hypothetical protein